MNPALPKRSLLIGRSSECDVVINHPEVSGRHAMINILPDGTIEVRDIGSKNGIYVNGEKVLHAVLRSGDKLTFGSYLVDWEEILRNPPPATGGSGSPTRVTRISTPTKNIWRTMAWVIGTAVVVLAILYFLVRPWIFQPK